MKRLLPFLAICFGLLNMGAAYTPVVNIANIAAVRAGNWSSLPQFTLRGYYTNNDGGEGPFTYTGTTSCTDDGGATIKDGAGNCFIRTNLNGNLAQWGLAVGSAYDIAANPTGASDAEPVIASAFTAIAAKSIPIAHTRGVSLRIATTLPIPKGLTLSCDVTPANSASSANYKVYKGRLVLAHGAYIDDSARDTQVTNCNVQAEFLINPAVATWTNGITSFSYPATTYSDLEAIRANMVTGGDYAFLTGPGSKHYNLSCMGFDNCFYASGASRSLVDKVWVDSNICFYASAGGGQTDAQEFDCEPLLTRQTGIAGGNEAYWTITNVTASPDNNNDAGLPVCRLALKQVGGTPQYSVALLHDSAVDAHGDPYYYPGYVANLDGPLSCNSSSVGPTGANFGVAVKVISTDTGAQTAVIDLLNTAYAHTADTCVSTGCVVTTAKWSSGNPVVNIAGPIANLAAGMTVVHTGNGFPTGTVTIVGVLQRASGPDPNDGYNGAIILSNAPTADSGGIVTIKVDGGAFGSNTSDCDGAKNYCFFYHSGLRNLAGSSPAGLAAAKISSGRGMHLSAGYFLDGVSGFRASNIFSYGHARNIIALDSNSCSIFQEAYDNQGELDAAGESSLEITGSSRGCIINGNKNGKTGSGIVLNTYGTVDATPISGATGMQALGKYTTGGTVTLSDTSGFATVGTAHVCAALLLSGACDTSQANEFINETVTDGTHLVVQVRGRWGTAPVAFTDPVYVIPTTITGGSTKHPDRSSTTIFENLTAASTTANLNQFELYHGAVSLEDVFSAAGGVAFISGNTAGVTLTAVNTPIANLYFENQTANLYTAIDTASNFANFVPANQPLPLTYIQPSGTAQSATDINALSTNGLGNITVTDQTGWPATGILLADSEYMSFSVPTTNTTKIAILARAQCGSTGAAHANPTTVVYYNTMLGCPVTGTPQFTIAGNGVVSVANGPLLTPTTISLTDPRVNAACDGTTDDTAKEAVAVALAGVGGTVVVPYNKTCVGQIFLNLANQTLYRSAGSTLKMPTGSGVAVVQVSANNVTVDGPGTIDGNKAGDAASIGVYGPSVSWLTVQNGNITNTGTYAIIATDAPHLHVTNEHLSVSGNNEILDTITNAGAADVPDQVFTRVNCDLTSGTGSTSDSCIHLISQSAGHYFTSVQIVNNYCVSHAAPSANTSGCYIVQGVKGLVVNGNYAKGTWAAFSFGGTCCGANANITVTTNIIDSAEKYAIEINSANGATVSSNVVNGNSITLQGIELDNSAGKTTVCGNTVTDTLTNGIDFEGGTNIAACGNNLINTVIGYVLSGVTQFALSGGNVWGNGSAGPAVRLLNTTAGSVGLIDFANWTTGITLSTSSAVVENNISIAGNSFVTVTTPLTTNFSGGGSCGSMIKVSGNSGIVNYDDYCNGNPSSALNFPSPPTGRLTLISAFPVMTADVNAATTVYYDAYVGKYVEVFDGTNWNQLKIASNEISMGLSSSNVLLGNLYDVFGVSNSGILVICVGPAWTSLSARGTGAGTTNIGKPQGVFTNTFDLTHCYGGAAGTTDYGTVLAGMATYLGTIYATANGQTQFNINPAAAAGGSVSGGNVVGIWNAYNRAPLISASLDSTASWTNTSSTWAVADAGATGSGLNNRISLVDGLGQSQPYASEQVRGSVASTSAMIGIDVDSTSATPTAQQGTDSTVKTAISVLYDGAPKLGFHYYQAMEQSATNTQTATFTGQLMLSVRWDY